MHVFCNLPYLTQETEYMI